MMTSVFFIKSREIPQCPLCGGPLASRDSRRRSFLEEDGTRKWLLIRRLECLSCGKLHSELPDFIQPFKHYVSEAIQKVVDQEPHHCAAEDSTMHRWKREFRLCCREIDSALVSLWIRSCRKPWELLRSVSLLEEIRKEHHHNWYAFVNRLLINAGYGTYTQFAFCPSSTDATLLSKPKRKGQSP